MKRIAWLCCVLLLAPMVFAGAAPATSAPAGAEGPQQIVDASSAGGEPPACLSAPQADPSRGALYPKGEALHLVIQIPLLGQSVRNPGGVYKSLGQLHLGSLSASPAPGLSQGF